MSARPPFAPWRAVGAVAAIGAVAAALGPGFSFLLDHAGDGLRIWRLGRLHLENVRGPHVGALSAQTLTLRDEAGVWAQAEGVELRWNPWALALGEIDITNIQARRLHILRRPGLSPARPSGPFEFGVRLGAVEIENLAFDAAVTGAAGQFRLAGNMRVDHGAPTRLNLYAASDAQSHAEGADERIFVRWRRDQNFLLDARIDSPSGGVVSSLFGDPSAAFTLEARGDGTAQAGQASGEAVLAGRRLGEASALWSGRTWSLAATGNPENAPALAAWRTRLGGETRLNASAGGGGAVRATLEAPNLALQLIAPRWRGYRLSGPASFNARTPNLARLAPEIVVGGGAATFEGRIAPERAGYRFTGDLRSRALNLAGLPFDMAGPIAVALDPRRIAFEGALRATHTPSPVFADARLTLALEHDRVRTRTSFRSAALQSRHMRVTMAGWAGRGGGELSGEWRLSALAPVWSQLRGQAEGRWTGTNRGREGWRIALAGGARGLAATLPPLGDLLGRDARIDAALRVTPGLVRVDHARMDSANLRLGLAGDIRAGQAALRLEASARGPARAGAAVIEGAADTIGTITGNLARPQIQTRTTLAALDIAGLAVSAPVIDLNVAPTASGVYAGSIMGEGRALGAPARLTSPITIDRNGISLPAVSVALADLRGAGMAALSQGGAHAELTLTGRLDGLPLSASGEVSGTTRLTDRAVTLNAELTDGAIAGITLRRAAFSLTGGYEDMAMRASLRGAIGQAPLTLEGHGRLAPRRDGVVVALTGEGALNNAPLRLLAPSEATLSPTGVTARGELALGEGRLSLHWRDTARVLSASADLSAAPLAPIAAIWGESARGRASGEARIASQDGAVSGAMDLRFEEAQLTSRANDVLNANVEARLAGERLTLRVDAQSQAGLAARLEASAPVSTSSAPLRIAFAPGGQGSASWSVRGPASGLWAATRINNQALEGQIEGEGSLRFGAAGLTGQGAIALTGGRFQDRASGLRLEAIDARIAFNEAGAQIERFTARDRAGGTLTAAGAAASAQEGEINLELHNLRVLDSPQMRAAGSGRLRLAWDASGSRIGGNIALNEASLRLGAAAAAATPQLEVVEINRPEDAAPTPSMRAPRLPTGAATLDVRVNAPGRIFTRGRGLSAEWSLDLRVTGAAASPRLFGQARTIRGDLSLSGSPFAITSGVINFDGPLEDARIDLVAERDAAEFTARIRIAGPAGDPEINLESTPALPEDEILPEALFGRSLADLSALEAAQLAASLAALSGRTSFDLADAARALTGLDRLDVREGADGGLLVAGGVYLGRDVYLEIARTSLGQAQTQVEWRVRPQLVLVTSFLPNGDRRASIRWRTER